MSYGLTRGSFKRKHKKVGLRQSNTVWKVFSRVVPIFVVGFFAAFFASSIFAPIISSNAAETLVTANVSSGSYSMTLTVTPSVTLNLMSSPTGAMTVGSGTVSAETNSPSGYKLYIGTSSSSNDLIHTENNTYRLQSNGTFVKPVALQSNTWGYAIQHGATSVLPSNGFDTSYTVAQNTAITGAKFAAVPTGTPQQIAETYSGNAGSPNVFSVYYGVAADYQSASGDYTNTVLFTGIADAGASAQMVVTPDETPAINGGDPLTITTTLYSTASDMTADAYVLTDAQRTQANAGTLDFSTVSAQKMTCSRDTTKTYLELNCTNVAMPFGDYYVYVNVPEYGVHYEKAFSYVKNFYNITYMQDMTSDICNDVKYVTTPSISVYNGKGINDTTTHSYPRATYADTGSATFRPNHLGDTNYVPETTMIDSRPSIFTKTGTEYTTDGNQVTEQVSYTIRKLADGNCWMTENLALNYEQGRQFTSTDTNVTSTKTAAHPTQALNGVPTDEEIATNCSSTLADRICWYEGTTAGDYSDRWLSRSSNGATESSLNFSPSVQTGEDQAVGTYYNWYTAVMGTVSSSQGAVEATEDICPANWRLPRYSAISGSWMYLIRDTYHLINTQGEQKRDGTATTDVNNLLHLFPFSLPYGGSVYRVTGDFNGQGVEGHSWSNGSYSEMRARSLDFYGTQVFPQADYTKTGGFSVRCLAQ